MILELVSAAGFVQGAKVSSDGYVELGYGSSHWIVKWHLVSDDRVVLAVGAASLVVRAESVVQARIYAVTTGGYTVKFSQAVSPDDLRAAVLELQQMARGVQPC